MSEKWEKEFFEWKDEIESKFNNLSQKNTELKKKFEEHLEDDSEEIRNELARQVELIGNNIEQIASLRENQANLESILRDHYNEHLRLGDLQEKGIVGEELLIYWNKTLKDGLEKLKSNLTRSWRIDPRVLDPDDEIVLDKITGVVSIIKGSGKKELYELYLKDKKQYYFKKITHPFTELNNMVHLGMGEVVATREDLKELLEMYHEGYNSEQPAVVEFLERIKEAWGV